MSEKKPGAAGEAPGQLASVLLEAALAKKRSTPAPASSGLDDIDSAVLQGGFRYGEITSIAGVSGVGKTLVGSLVFFYCKVHTNWTHYVSNVYCSCLTPIGNLKIEHNED